MRPLLALLVCTATVTHAELLSPVWVELGEGGRAVARIVVSSEADCPEVRIGTATHRMSPRRPVPPGLPPACEFVMPGNAKATSVDGKPLALARLTPLVSWSSATRAAVSKARHSRIATIQSSGRLRALLALRQPLGRIWSFT